MGLLPSPDVVVGDARPYTCGACGRAGYALGLCESHWEYLKDGFDPYTDPEMTRKPKRKTANTRLLHVLLRCKACPGVDFSLWDGMCLPCHQEEASAA